MQTVKKLLFCVLAIVSVWGLYKFCHKQTDGFAVGKIRPAFFSSAPAPDTHPYDAIFSQSFSYIGRGGQCYAFASEDGEHILKLLKYNNNYPRIWFRICSFPFGLESYRQRKLSEKAKKLEDEYTSYYIAFKELRKETGILYSHLCHHTLPSHTKLHIRDKIGVSHTLQADNFQFYIQKKGTPFYLGLKKIVEDKGEIAGKQALDEFVEYLFLRCQKHISDGDRGIRRNFAFDGLHPFQIDIGQFAYDSSLDSMENQKHHIIFFIEGLVRWLNTWNPSLADHVLYIVKQKGAACENTAKSP